MSWEQHTTFKSTVTKQFFNDEETIEELFEGSVPNSVGSIGVSAGCIMKDPVNESWEDATNSSDDDLSENVENKIFLSEYENDDVAIIDDETCDKYAEYTNFDKNLNFDCEPLRHNLDFEKSMHLEMENKMNEFDYIDILKSRKGFSVFRKKKEILDLLYSNQVFIICGSPGCGRTTQVPQYILDDSIEKNVSSNCFIVCLQQRRINALYAAKQASAERLETCGKSIGYHVRFDKKEPRRRASILYCTIGIILQWLVFDKKLSHISHLIIDEVDERDIFTDFIMIIVRDLINMRHDLKVILMCPHIYADELSKYWGNCYVCNIPDTTHNIKEFWLEDILEMLHYQPNDSIYINTNLKFSKDGEKLNYENWIRSLSHKKYSSSTIELLRKSRCDKMNFDLILKLIEYICRNYGKGSILVFLPSFVEVNKLYTLLNSSPILKRIKNSVLSFHLLLETFINFNDIDDNKNNTRKIFLASTTSESLININDVTYIIDCAMIKLKRFDLKKNISIIETQLVNRPFMKQRRCYASHFSNSEVYFYLLNSYDFEHLKESEAPELLRFRLEESCLQIKCLKLGQVLNFLERAINRPEKQSIKVALKTLVKLHALELDTEELTALGWHLSRLPIDLFCGKMLIFGSIFSCLDPILTIASGLCYRNVFSVPFNKEDEFRKIKQNMDCGLQSDHLVLVKAFNSWMKACSVSSVAASEFCKTNFLSESILKQIAIIRKQLAILLKNIGFIVSEEPLHGASNFNSSNYLLVKALVGAGLYPNVAKIIIKDNKADKTSNFTKKKYRLEGEIDRRLYLDVNSVNYSSDNFNNSWLVYNYKLFTDKLYVLNSTAISAYSLIFFGGQLEYKRDKEQDLIIVDKWIEFRCSQKISNVMNELRNEFDSILDSKISKPSATNWDRDSKEGICMRAIIDLITTDESKIPKNVLRK